jgi:hypothetical protein
MKPLVISVLFFFQLTAQAQIYVPLKIVKGIATFEAIAEVENLSAADIHDRTKEWIDKTFMSEPVVTQDIATRISARFYQDYSKDGWADSFQHNLQIDILDGKAVFTITDTERGLVRDGAWKANLAKMRVMLEQAANDLFWSYESYLKQTSKGK